MLVKLLTLVAMWAVSAVVSAPAARGPADYPLADCDLDVVHRLAERHPDAGQFVVGATDDFDATHGVVYVATRRGAGWSCDTAELSAAFGRAGTRPLRERRSGDDTTPAGVFPLGTMTAWDGERFEMFGNAPPPDRLTARYRRVHPDDCWGATPGSADYQRLVRAPVCPGPDDEWLEGFGDAYRHAVVIGANLGTGLGDDTDQVSGDTVGEPPYASAIFLHHHSYDDAGAAKPTSGCVSLGAHDLIDVMARIDPARDPHFALGPRDWLGTPPLPVHR